MTHLACPSYPNCSDDPAHCLEKNPKAELIGHKAMTHNQTPWKYEVVWGGLMTANWMPLRNGGCNSMRMGFVITHGDDSETHAAVNCASNAAFICRAVNAHDDLVAALADMLAGWKYIRANHGDLYGVGWERAQEKAEAALEKAGA